MATATLPQVSRIIKVGPTVYVCHVTGDTWKAPGFDARMSDDLVHTGKSYNDSLPSVPKGYRMADSELIAFLAQETERLKAEGRDPRETLKDPAFARQIEGKPYRWEHTHGLLRPPKGAADFTRYVETDEDGRKYSRVDKYAGDKLMAEGALMPWGKWSRVTRLNPVLRMPAAVSDEDVPHVMHSYFEPTANEVVVGLDGGWHADELDRCLDFDAGYGRSAANSDCAFRLVEGSLDDLPVPTVERSIKDTESYEKGLVKGRKEGAAEADKRFTDQLRSLSVAELLERYTKQ